MALEEDAAGPSRSMECLYRINGIITQKTKSSQKQNFLQCSRGLLTRGLR